MNADPGTQGRPTEQKSHLHISCNNKWVQGKKDWCDNTTAFVVNPSGDKDDSDDESDSDEEDGSDEDTDSNEDGISEVRLNLCPRFWWLPRFDKLKATAKSPSDSGVTRADDDLVQRAIYLKIRGNSDGKTYSKGFLDRYRYV